MYDIIIIISFLLPLFSSSIINVSDTSWELIGSRTYEYTTHHTLQCRRWDKVALRWHMYSCSKHNSSDCDGGSNIDYALPPSDLHSGQWHNAFTYVQYDSKDTEMNLLLSLPSLNESIMIPSIVPLKIDLDWKWTLDEQMCNHFTIRMSGMSSLQHMKKDEVTSFCRLFDKDLFISCDNL